MACLSLRFLFSTLLFIGLVSVSFAGTLTGEFQFKKRAPRGAIVYFSEDQSLKAAPLIDQVNQNFTTSFMVGPKGSIATFKNSDTVNHNIYADDKQAKVSFDVGLAPPGSETSQEITWDAGNVVVISCKIHPKMRAWIASVPSQYHSVVEFKRKQKKASIEIAGVPDSLSKLTIWLPGYEEIQTEIPKGGTKTVDLVRKKKTAGTLTLNHN